MLKPAAHKDRRVLMVDAMSGNNDFAVALCDSLSRICTLSVFTVENSPLNSFTGYAHVIKAWPLFGGGVNRASIKKLLNALTSLMRVLWEHRAGTVHLQFPRFFLLETIIFLFARLLLRRLVFTAHNAVPHECSQWHLMVLHVWYRLPDKIVVLSDNVRREIVKRFGIVENRIVVIPHGNYAAFRQSNYGKAPNDHVAAKLRAVNNKILILEFGIIREYKGVDTLIAAAKLLPKKLPWHILIAGGGSPTLVERYRAEISANELKSRITILHGFLPDNDLAALLERSDILVFPYRGISQSGALLMGMTYGKPCVCTDLPGFREYIGKSDAIFFDENNATTQLSAALAQLLTDQALRQRLGQAAWTLADERYAWEKVASAYLDVYTLAAD